MSILYNMTTARLINANTQLSLANNNLPNPEYNNLKYCHRFPNTVGQLLYSSASQLSYTCVNPSMYILHQFFWLDSIFCILHISSSSHICTSFAICASLEATTALEFYKDSNSDHQFISASGKLTERLKFEHSPVPLTSAQPHQQHTMTIPTTPTMLISKYMRKAENVS
jgi:hypothetical protein